LIKNSWIIQLNRGPEERLTKSNPGVIRADPKTTFFYRLFRGEIVPDLAAGHVSTNILIDVKNGLTGAFTK